MQYQFTKMQSLGNDFILLDGVAAKLNVTPKIARRLADRHFGVGCDQVLLVEAGDHDGNHDRDEFLFRIFNSDGGEVEQCGNGARCLALFLRDIGLLGDTKTVRVRTKNRAMKLVINDDDTVTVDMGIPQFAPPEIPFIADREAKTYALDLAGDEVEIVALAIGNPHAVRVVADIKNAPVATQGALTETHPRFPSRVNAGFMEIVARDHIRLRVHERGVGETLGCGSGACAAVVAGVNLGLLDEAVTVTLPGGDAKVTWQGAGKSVFLSGDAHIVFRGEISVR